MPEEVIAYIAEYAAEAYGADAIATYATLYEVASYASYVAFAASVYTMREQQRRAENRARDGYNASLKDRYVMVRGATEPRQLILGRQRVAGPVAFLQSYGTARQNLALVEVLAAHECDGIEDIYVDDEPVVMDGSGNVTGIRREESFTITGATATVTLSSVLKGGTVTATAQYGTDVVTLSVSTPTSTTVSVSGARAATTGLLVVRYQPDPCPYAMSGTDSKSVVVTPSFGTNTVTLPDVPNTGAVVVAWSAGSGQDKQDVTLTLSASGADVTFNYTGSDIAAVTISYQVSTSGSRMRVRKFLGAPGQTADATLISNLPGVWTSAHAGTGLAYLSADLLYDTDAFPGGIPNISAVVRGLKCYDPRTGTTAWTENPALLMRAYAIHPLGGRLNASQIDDDSIMAAANVCDTSTVYTVGGQAYTRPLYTAGMLVRVGARPADVLTDLAQAMGGRWCMVDGRLRVKAGCYSAPVMALDESWMHEGGTVQVQPHRARLDVVNAATGTFVDAGNDYKVLAFPKVTASAYVTEDGTELPIDIPMAAVTWVGQAQYIAACQLRYARQGCTVKLTCNLRAYQLEPFDVITVSLARYGWVAKTFEVLDVSWTLDGGIELSLKEIDPSIWQMDAGFPAQDPAPNTRLPVPFGLPVIAGLALLSDDTTVAKQADGSKLLRLRASWTAVADQRVSAIELKWGRATTPESSWETVTCGPADTAAYLAPVHLQGAYLVKARTVSEKSASPWSAHILYSVTTTGAFGGSIDFSAVTGSTKPADNATHNAVTVSGAEPTDPLDGDIWKDTSTTPATIKLRSGGAWVTGANLTTGQLAMLDTVDTGQIAANAATVVSTGFFAGPYDFSVSA